MFSAFNEWLAVEVKGWKVVRLYFLLFVAMMGWLIATAIILTASGYQPPADPLGIKLEYTFELLQLVLVLALAEEAIFRFPLLLAVFLERNVLSAPVVITSAVLLSAIFGYLHGGMVNIITQGVLGLFFSIFFLKCGGYQYRYVKAMLASTILHASWNLFLFNLLLSAGVTEI